MNSLEQKIYFHLNTLKKVSIVSNEIIKELNDRNTDSALHNIQNRERLLNVVFKLHKTIESSISDLQITDSTKKELIKSWGQEVNNWSQEQSSLNDQIEELLIVVKVETKMEIASIFDKKSRHKGYDLTSLK